MRLERNHYLSSNIKECERKMDTKIVIKWTPPLKKFLHLIELSLKYNLIKRHWQSGLIKIVDKSEGLKIIRQQLY